MSPAARPAAVRGRGAARRLATFPAGGDRLAYETYGQGPRVLVLLPGLLLGAGTNRGVAQALAAHGHRVVLLDPVGHGRSDRPIRAATHRIDRYADQTVVLLDHLRVEEAVLGGPSLGANVALHAAVRAPERVRGLVVEMPLLERAAPAAGLAVLPALVANRFGAPLTRLLTRGVRHVPRTGVGPVDSVLDAWSVDPREIAAVLHGLLVGPIAPSVEERTAITAPALVVGHRRDALHPFSDAADLAGQLPHGRLVRARSALELRITPTRLVTEIAGFLEEVWRPRSASEPSAVSSG